MRIVSWNVNSIRTLKQYHPWCEHKSYATILETLNADIVCFQEMKITKSNVDSDLALVPGYDAFFTFPKKRHGYAGSTTYVRSAFTPVDAEEGFTGSASGTRGSSAINGEIGCYGELYSEFTAAELAELDAEGRVIITDHRLFVLINAYFPVDDPDEDRHAFRMRFYRAMRMRIDALIEAGRQVVLAGDINACYSARDHCDPKKSMREHGIDEFWDTPARTWLRDLVQPKGPLHDTYRVLHPDAEKPFTCWNTLINARPVNYGTRIDYILITHGLLPWLCESAVEAEVLGSDHCPVSCHFHDVHPETGEDICGAMTPEGGNLEMTRHPPKLCVKYWETFSGTQKKLSSFFVPKAERDGQAKAAAEEQEYVETSVDAPAPEKPVLKGPPVPIVAAPVSEKVATSVARPRKTLMPAATVAGKKKGAKPSQPKIAAFFGTKVAAPPPPNLTSKSNGQNSLSTSSASASVTEPIPPLTGDLGATSKDVSPSSQSTSRDHSPVSTQQNVAALLVPTNGQAEAAASQWRTLLNKPPPPVCYHREPAKQFTVNKPGINRGRSFYLCARPVGPEHDPRMAEDTLGDANVVLPSQSSQTSSASSQNNPSAIMSTAYSRGRKPLAETRCNFFQWLKPPKRTLPNADRNGDDGSVDKKRKS
ncbi:Endonuclease/exonuclease/phosphatase [Powellomyces hirtus]|nr:Endonuclease/exonuclease/phosphatase [Powellomyces hirtus]